MLEAILDFFKFLRDLYDSLSPSAQATIKETLREIMDSIFRSFYQQAQS